MKDLTELRKKISEILVKWGMPTRQVAINEIVELLTPKQSVSGEDAYKGWHKELQQRMVGRTIRPVAKEIGISSASLSRALSGKEPSLKNYFKITNWFYRQKGKQ